MADYQKMYAVLCGAVDGVIELKSMRRKTAQVSD